MPDLPRHSDHQPLPPARPHNAFTEDGRRKREVLTYSRRGHRFTPSQQDNWDAHHEKWYIDDASVERPDFSLAEAFGREAPLIVEIGSGIGEATAALAAARPECNVLALEVWLPGVAHSLGLVAQSGAENVRFISIDAVWALENLIEPEGLAELWTFFPDPWPKKRHHKRRLVSPGFANLVATRLKPSGLWRLATDWEDYAEQMREVLDAAPEFEGGPVERWADRPVTKFERKGLAKDHVVTDFSYRRR